ncbi:MAG: hypothetical protein Q9159_004573 [Coniocarpon cinnabarinum]
MATHPRVEELSDSDPDEMDISTVAPPSNAQAGGSNPTLMQGSHIPTQRNSKFTQENTKHYQCLYPIYFDAARSRAQGRRVSAQLAVPNPLAREIADAVFSLSMQPVVEPEKTHPRDWANPGRIRVLVKEDGRPKSRTVKNSAFTMLDAAENEKGVGADPTHTEHDLYNKVAQYLQAHPTNEKSPQRLKLVGMPSSMESPAPPAIPRGWKMNSILPLHSPALSGGGVSENLFKDMMAEMQGDQSPANAGGSKPKKDKKVKG